MTTEITGLPTQLYQVEVVYIDKDCDRDEEPELITDTEDNITEKNLRQKVQYWLKW